MTDIKFKIICLILFLCISGNLYPNITYGYTQMEARDAIINNQDSPYLGLDPYLFRKCFFQTSMDARDRNLMQSFFDETNPYYVEIQAALQTLVIKHKLDKIKKGRLVEHLSANERQWEKYKKIYGQVTFLMGPSLGGVFNMARDHYFSELNNYYRNYSISGLYDVYFEARRRGSDHNGAMYRVESATLSSRRYSASWYRAIGYMSDVSQKFSLKYSGQELVGLSFAHTYKKKDKYSVNTDDVVEDVIRWRAELASDSAVKYLRYNPMLKRCVDNPPDKHTDRYEPSVTPPQYNPNLKGKSYVVWIHSEDRTCCPANFNGVKPFRFHGTPKEKVRAGARVLNTFRTKEEMNKWVCERKVHRAHHWIDNWARLNGHIVSNLPCEANAPFNE